MGQDVAHPFQAAQFSRTPPQRVIGHLHQTQPFHCRAELNRNRCQAIQVRRKESALLPVGNHQFAQLVATGMQRRNDRLPQSQRADRGPVHRQQIGFGLQRIAQEGFARHHHALLKTLPVRICDNWLVQFYAVDVFRQQLKFARGFIQQLHKRQRATKERGNLFQGATQQVI